MLANALQMLPHVVVSLVLVREHALILDPNIVIKLHTLVLLPLRCLLLVHYFDFLCLCPSMHAISMGSITMDAILVHSILDLSIQS